MLTSFQCCSSKWCAGWSGSHSIESPHSDGVVRVRAQGGELRMRGAPAGRGERGRRVAARGAARLLPRHHVAQQLAIP